MTNNLPVAISPGSQEIMLVPGESYDGEFSIINTFSGMDSVHYSVNIAPMTVEDENFSLDFKDVTDFSQIIDWIEVENPEGDLNVGENIKIKYHISVPENPPAGGQYAAFLVSTSKPGSTLESDSAEGIEGVTLHTRSQIAMLLYAIVSGETVVEGTVIENNIPQFFIDCPVKVSSLLSNTGNVHSNATYKMRIYSLFSQEEIYTNEESPITNLIIPGSKFYSEKTWDETPRLGVFRVEQEIDFAGNINLESRVVLVSPLWFVVLCLVFFVALVFSIFERIFFQKKS